MISLYRVSSLCFRTLMIMRRPLWVVEITYWTVLDVLIFGSMGVATAMVTASDIGHATIQTLLTNSVLWYIILRGAIHMGYAVLNELFDANLISIFATPVRIREWFFACIITSALEVVINIMLGWIVSWLVFGYNVFVLGPATLPIIFSLTIFGWVVGLALMSVLLLVGKRGAGITYAICWSLVPFSCVYFPLEVFPLFLQKIVWLLPSAQVFTAVRTIITTGEIPWNTITSSLLVNILFLVIATAVTILMFKHSKKNGLARLELL